MYPHVPTTRAQILIADFRTSVKPHLCNVTDMTGVTGQSYRAAWEGNPYQPLPPPPLGLDTCTATNAVRRKCTLEKRQLLDHQAAPCLRTRRVSPKDDRECTFEDPDFYGSLAIAVMNHQFWRQFDLLRIAKQFEIVPPASSATAGVSITVVCRGGWERAGVSE
jgi:hypothetical protein